jgi:hypothetical protein
MSLGRSAQSVDGKKYFIWEKHHFSHFHLVAWLSGNRNPSYTLSSGLSSNRKEYLTFIRPLAQSSLPPEAGYLWAGEWGIGGNF